MDFSADGSDSWVSTPAQDKFIENYFREQEPQSSSVTKGPKKRKKHILNSGMPSTSIIPKTKSSVAIKPSSDLDAAKIDAGFNVETESFVKKSEKSDCPKFVARDNFKKAKKSIKKSLKMIPNDFTVTNLNNDNVNNDFTESSCQKDKNSLKKRNLKKRKPSTCQTSPTQNNLSKIDADCKIKRFKDTADTLNPKETVPNIDESGDSDEDEVIRNELQNTPMFKKIQKLMKLAPHLNPNFTEDMEANNSSSEEVSVEDWSSEMDDDLSGSEVKVSKGDYKNASEISSESEAEDLHRKKASQSDSLQVKKKLKKSLGNSSLNEDKILESFPKTSKETLETSNNEQSSNLISSPLINRNSSKLRDNENAKRSSSFMEKTRAKLAAAKFRFLNEKLYTESGGDAFKYFQENREEFEDYHLGYGMQVSKWPLNPVNEIIADLQKSKKDVVIADMGCGDAKIARVLTNKKVHSFDLVAMHECVTACNFSRVPLPDSNVDVVVFCLSLMGTNLVDYLHEAYRILKIGGSLKIAEVESRIENLDLFIKNLNSLGFALEKKNTKNKLFVFLDLKKVKKGKASKAPMITLRPCLYKKR